jgi:hypothetical protein
MQSVLTARHLLPRGLRILITLLMVGTLSVAMAPGDGPKPGAGDKKGDKSPAAGSVEVRFTDGSVLKLRLRDEKLEVKTPYGKLAVPVADIQRIEFATRIPEDDTRKITAAVARLGKDDFKERETASEELLRFGARAYPALLVAAQSDEPEVRKRAEELLEKIRATVPESDLEVRKHDLIFLEDWKILGTIEATTFKANTAQFGEQQVKLADVRSLRAEGVSEPGGAAVAGVQADPGTLTGFQGFIGQKFAFTVTGRADGSVFGTDVYTTDSMLATAAVHAGVLRVGQTGTVKVQIIASPPGFAPSTRNGVTSAAWGPYPAAYQILKK